MPTKKKPRPLFEVPIEIGSGRESGWVYKSGVTADEPVVHATVVHEPVVNSDTSTGVVAESAQALALSVAAVTQVFVMVVAIAIVPITLGLAAVRSLAKANARD